MNINLDFIQEIELKEKSEKEIEKVNAQKKDETPRGNSESQPLDLYRTLFARGSLSIDEVFNKLWKGPNSPPSNGPGETVAEEDGVFDESGRLLYYAGGLELLCESLKSGTIIEDLLNSWKFPYYEYMF